MTTYIIRASHANQFELQNYEPLLKSQDIRLVTSLRPLTPTHMPTTQLWSPTDLPNFPFRRQLFNRLFGGEQWLIGLEQVITTNPGPHILHTAETYTPYTHQAVQLRQKGIIKKLVCTCWETMPHNNEKFRRLRRWKQMAYETVDLFHVTTERAKKALITEGVCAHKIKVIPYGVDLSRFHPIRGTSRRPKPVIVTVARRVPEKGYFLWQKIKEELREIADFRWVSGLPYADMPAVYAESDIFFLPSLTTSTWEEQYGMVLLEAMASGLPVVTTNTGAIPEVVGEAALVLNPTTYHDLVSPLKDLLTQPRLRQKLAKLSLARARDLSHLVASARLTSLYH
ncbi:hypothetical protein DCC61_03990 [Candidatus Microgenomates bacterium]|nr:glycosyltransferase [Candidatus Microgenomates bacterium CPR3]RIK50993.1 MAG: hypothetical protein DCC61_03990 [Candidatus Microgenomates bacterium]